MVNTCNPGNSRLRRENSKFKVRLGYMARLIWGEGGKKKKKEKKERNSGQ